MNSPRQVYVLWGWDPATGGATRPAGVVGVAGDAHYISWIPVEPAAEPWRERLHDVPGGGMAERMDYWVEAANGITLDAHPVDAPESADLVGAVETVLDELLVADGEQRGW